MASAFSDPQPLTEDEQRVWAYLARTDPTSPALLPLARAFIDAGDPAQALGVAKRVRAAHPALMEAALLTARALTDLGRTAEARAVLARAEARLNELAPVLEELADLMSELDDAPTAIRARAAARALGSGAGSLAPARADDSGRPPEAAADEVPTGTLALLYLKQGHREKAADIYRRLLQNDPSNEEWRDQLAALVTGPEKEALLQMKLPLAEETDGSPAPPTDADSGSEGGDNELTRSDNQDTLTDSGADPVPDPESELDPHQAARKKLARRLVRLQSAARRRKEEAFARDK